MNTPPAQSDITRLGASDSVKVAHLMGSSYDDDLGFGFTFRSRISQQRWLPKVCIASTQLAMNYGVVTGCQVDESIELSAVASWFLPSRPFPPPWYHSLLPSLPLLPMVLTLLPTVIRMERLYRLYLSLMPRDRRFIYLSGLAVHKDYRNRHLGKRLVTWGQDLARTEDCAVFLHCWPALVPYYERLGFSHFAAGELRGIDSKCHGLLWEP